MLDKQCLIMDCVIQIIDYTSFAFSLHKEAPSYLSDLLSFKKYARENFRSCMDDLTLQIPVTKYRTFADRSFSVYGPKLWNIISRIVLEVQKTLHPLKRNLKHTCLTSKDSKFICYYFKAPSKVLLTHFGAISS